ncbi:choline kinase, cytoplasm [Fistulina hepatica ATCC 64428]|uniref:Choline kinase, cytoplasm n=1 Tax=Fistulina hepatica ATCC 64428 TaxID=1128425 RepID=A0A0D7AKN2_9AGAR|nr:choline kinase, cytoplasm [Fistulina hepatica ATCC 64428]
MLESSLPTSALPTHHHHSSSAKLAFRRSHHSIALSSSSYSGAGHLSSAPITEDGLVHSKLRLSARDYKKPEFAATLLAIMQDLAIPSWSKPAIAPHLLDITKVSGALTNSIFFVSCSVVPGVHNILLRIYGASSGSLISRPRELHTLHVLSSRYRLGPRVYGTFENGRLEEYFDSTTLSAADLRDPSISSWIGARMAEFHSVDIDVVEETSPDKKGEGRGWDIAAKLNVPLWLPYAYAVVASKHFPEPIRKALDLDAFVEEWETYRNWLSVRDDRGHGSRRVFAHNDTQYGNILRLKAHKPGAPEHRQLIVVDFEYAAPNPASYDIANHFQEWTADYHSATPHLLVQAKYPTFEQRRNFYMAYLEHSSPRGTFDALSAGERESVIADLDYQVAIWSPASHAVWAIWGLVQAREDVESQNPQPDFDYIGYAMCRMECFRRELKALGIPPLNSCS